MEKLNAVVFYQYLPPWRIDVFNEMAKYYNMTIVFTDADTDGFTYSRESLLSQLRGINTIFLNTGFRLGGRPIRIGILKMLNKYKPDVVFSHEYSPTSIIAALYKNIFHYRYVITTSDNVSMAKAVTGLKYQMRHFVLSKADGAIVYSEPVKSWYKDKFPKLKLGICPNIQNPETLLKYRSSFSDKIRELDNKYSLENSQIILYTGRLVQVKGLDLLLKAYAKAENAKTKLVLVGEGNQKEYLQSIVETEQLQDKVVFVGYASGIDLYVWYEIADFFVLPSRYEPFGAVINEALVFGCPVVSSKYIGALDFVNESNGLIFDPLSVHDFVATLNKAIKKYSIHNGTRKNLMIRNFYSYVEVFRTILDK